MVSKSDIGRCMSGVRLNLIKDSPVEPKRFTLITEYCLVQTKDRIKHDLHKQNYRCQNRTETNKYQLSQVLFTGPRFPTAVILLIPHK